MKDAKKNIWLAGVDGCPEGWMVTFLRPKDMVIRQRVIERFIEIFKQPEKPTIIVVDMPIGLPRCSPTQGRGAEKAIRMHLGKRRSSVFRVPSRAAVYCAADKETVPNEKARYAKACAIARNTSVDKKAFAQQGFNICRKIVEVDRILRRDKAHKSKVFECHPELAFWQMNNRRPLEHSKKSADGKVYRRTLLINAGIPEAVIKLKPPKGAKRDDVVDSLACAVVAQRIHHRIARSYPSPPLHDGQGLPMAIWA